MNDSKLLHNIAVGCLAEANLDPQLALEEFLDEIRDAGGLMCALVDAAGAAEQLALEYLECVARDIKG
jgi:hypothetical protein